MSNRGVYKDVRGGGGWDMKVSTLIKDGKAPEGALASPRLQREGEVE